jgi:leader peptidase (prepilin peptidase)/N-methyltransferase
MVARWTFGIVSIAAAIVSVFVAPDSRGILGGCLALLMCAIALHDARHYVIPNWLNAAALALALAHAAASEPQMAASEVGLALVRGCIAGAVFLAIKVGYQWFRGRDGMGMGDVKLAAVAGAWLDWIAIVVAVEIAVAAALVTYVLLRYVGKRPLRATSALPFGLYFAPAIWVGWLFQMLLLAP